MHWTIDGPADAPPIVFLHGAIVAGMWGPQVRALRDRYRCITVDLPGHGRLASTPYTLDAAVEAVRAAIDGAAGGRAVVVGLSLGGYTAMAVAARHPDRVRALVVADASREPRGLIVPAFLLYGWLLRLLPARLVKEVGVGLFRRAYGPQLAAELAAGFDAPAGGRAVLAITGRGFRAMLRAYPGPILLVNGALDRIFVRGEQELAGDLPNVRILRIPGAAHLASMDAPDAFTRALVGFVEQLPG